jgi:Recombinase
VAALSVDSHICMSQSDLPTLDGHDVPMKPVHGETSSRRRGIRGALANKRAADFRANALASTLRELKAEGFISRRSLANELNRRGIPTALGGRWHYTTVVRMLTRLGLLTWGKGARINNGQAKKHAADMRAEALAATIAKLRNAGFVSMRAMARELNEQEIPTAQAGKWHPSSVRRLLRRLKRLEASSCAGVTPGEDASEVGEAANVVAEAVFLPVESI